MAQSMPPRSYQPTLYGSLPTTCNMNAVTSSAALLMINTTPAKHRNVTFVAQ